MTADKMSLGITYKIIEVSTCDIKPRLTDMCCVPNSLITKLFEAPGGDPIAYLINQDYVLSLRISEASKIIVEENK